MNVSVRSIPMFWLCYHVGFGATMLAIAFVLGGFEISGESRIAFPLVGFFTLGLSVINLVVIAIAVCTKRSYRKRPKRLAIATTATIVIVWAAFASGVLAGESGDRGGMPGVTITFAIAHVLALATGILCSRIRRPSTRLSRSLRGGRQVDRRS
ncbi:MAG: hypothetical protein H7X80_08275 [bacterium]|nr:hypothetical protein [Candidatus Kapabacteria bacterium]